METVEIGVALETFDYETGRPLPIAEVTRQARHAEELGFRSAWAMDHLFLQRDHRRAGALDPMVTLAYAASATREIRLGSLVLCNGFRGPHQVAREAIALADASGGRFVLGLGAGWHRPEFEAFGLPFDGRVARLAETLAVLRPLMAGERVTERGRYTNLVDAWLPATAPPPPIWLAGAGERMLALTAVHAQGWNLAWGGPDPQWLAEPVARLRAACVQAGRDPASLTISAGLLAIPVEGAPAREGVFTGSPQELAEVITAYGEAGVQHLMLSLAPAPFAHVDTRHMERAAAALPG